MSIEAIERWVGQPLPEPYRAYLCRLEDDRLIGDTVLLYGRSSFVERNETFETKKYCPQHVTIGDDSGGAQFILSLADGRIALVDAGSMAPELARSVADDFETWLEDGCPVPDRRSEP